VRYPTLASGRIREVVAVGDANTNNHAFLHELADFAPMPVDFPETRNPITHFHHLVRLCA